MLPTIELVKVFVAAILRGVTEEIQFSFKFSCTRTKVYLHLRAFISRSSIDRILFYVGSCDEPSAMVLLTQFCFCLALLREPREP